MKKTVISLLLIFALIFSFAACKNESEKETTTRKAETTTLAQQITPDKETTAPAEETTKEEETTETAFAFNKAEATYLGKTDSEIYGTLSLYLQEDKIVIFDEYKDIKFLLEANGYTTQKTESKVEVESTDLNFDGYADFMLLYSETEFNTYYFCWIWDMAERP